MVSRFIVRQSFDFSFFDFFFCFFFLLRTSLSLSCIGGLVQVLVDGLKKGNLYAGAMSPLMGSMLHNATLFYVNGATRNLLYDPNNLQPVRDAFIAG